MLNKRTRSDVNSKGAGWEKDVIGMQRYKESHVDQEKP